MCPHHRWHPVCDRSICTYNAFISPSTQATVLRSVWRGGTGVYEDSGGALTVRGHLPNSFFKRAAETVGTRAIKTIMVIARPSAKALFGPVPLNSGGVPSWLVLGKVYMHVSFGDQWSTNLIECMMARQRISYACVGSQDLTFRRAANSRDREECEYRLYESSYAPADIPISLRSVARYRYRLAGKQVCGCGSRCYRIRQSHRTSQQVYTQI